MGADLKGRFKGVERLVILAEPIERDPFVIPGVFARGVDLDNLDRCLPEQSIELLESLSNILNVERCIFFIAVDRHVIVSFINKKYGTEGLNGYEYLEKIVTFDFNISNSVMIQERTASIVEFINTLLGEKILTDNIRTNFIDLVSDKPM